MEHPFHVVWFDAAHAEQAMRLLEILPASERIERGRPHLFRMWENCPLPNLDGTWSGKHCHCVVVDRFGSVALQAGGMQTREADGKQPHCTIMDYCENVVEIAPSFLAGYVKPDTWTLPKFAAAAKEAREHDARIAQKVVEIKEAKLERENTEIVAFNKTVSRRFFDACGHMIMAERDPKKLSQQDLIDVLTIAEMNGASFPPLESWMELHGKPLQSRPESKPYDPVTFLAHVNAVMNAQGLERRKFQVELDSQGRPIESTRKRIA